MDQQRQQEELRELTADIVSAFVTKNAIQQADLPKLIGDVFRALSTLAEPQAAEAPAVALKPAVPVKKSITDDYIICLEDGKQFKSLKRHLAAHYNLTPEEYRAKWGLPADYPMVAPSYAATRSKLARDIGLGRRAAEAETPKPAGRKGKTKAS